MIAATTFCLFHGVWDEHDTVYISARIGYNVVETIEQVLDKPELKHISRIKYYHKSIR